MSTCICCMFYCCFILFISLIFFFKYFEDLYIFRHLCASAVVMLVVLIQGLRDPDRSVHTPEDPVRSRDHNRTET